jgi:NADP-dependent 3-hydroxy acid dehydrogenase YdfG
MTHAASKDDLRVSTLFDFSSHIVLVTGGATGLGEMAAQAFVQNGSRVFIASRKEKELKSTSDRLNALGPGTCEYVVADLKNKAGCVALCAEMKKRTDRLTVLVNNTGASWGDDYYDYPEHAWDKLYDLNVKNIFYMTVGMEPLLLKGADAGSPGRVINIASMAGIQTMDVTTGEGGGLSKPGHGTFSCEFIMNLNLELVELTYV